MFFFPLNYDTLSQPCQLSFSIVAEQAMMKKDNKCDEYNYEIAKFQFWINL